MVCLDSGYSVSLINRAYLKIANPDLDIRTIASPITIRGIGTNKHVTSEYIITPLIFPSQRDSKSVLASTVPRELYVVNKLKVRILISTDIIEPEKIDILAS